jgi:hypothetical protein
MPPSEWPVKATECFFFFFFNFVLPCIIV